MKSSKEGIENNVKKKKPKQKTTKNTQESKAKKREMKIRCKIAIFNNTKLTKKLLSK